MVNLLFTNNVFNIGEDLETPYILVVVTTASKAEAENIAKHLLENKLIACANILGPITSHFYWEGKVDCSEEFLMLMKSRSDLFGEVTEEVRKLHSYEVPEVLALAISAGSKSYLDWLSDTLR